MWFEQNGEARLGTGYGLIADLVLASTFWTIFQVILFQWPDLSSYNLKREAYLDLRNRMVSFFHGLMCIYVSFYVWLT